MKGQLCSSFLCLDILRVGIFLLLMLSISKNYINVLLY